MSQTTNKMSLKDKQTKVRRIDLNKFTLGTVQGGKFQYIIIGNIYKINLNCYSAFFYNFSILYPWRISYIIQFLLDDLDPILVDHLSHYLSVCPIRHPLQFSVSCGNQNSTVQESSPHKCGQKVSCKAFNALAATFLQIFPNFHSSNTFMMHVPLSRIFQNVTLSNRIYI